MHKSILSLESIDFQDKRFFDDLTKAVRDIRAVRDWKSVNLKQAADYYSDPKVVKISEIIQKHTSGQKTHGLSVTVRPEYRIAAASINIPYLTDKHVLMNEFERTTISEKLPMSLERIAKVLKVKNVVGVVDIRNNAFGGIYSEIPITLSIDPIVLMDMGKNAYTSSFVGWKLQFTDEEVAACILHEVGHIATTFEYMNRVYSTNQSLAALANARLMSEADAKATVVNLVADKEGLDEAQRTALLLAKDFDEVGLILYAAGVEKSISELGDSVYDSTSIEYLADQYAARCGAGSSLVSSIAKLNVAFPRNPSNGLADGVVTFVASLMKATGMNAGYATSVIGAGERIDRDRATNVTYDEPHVRINRIRDQLIQRLKDPTISDDLKKSILKDIESVDMINKDIKEVNPGLFARIQEIFNPRLKMSNKFKILQKDLEKIGHSDLFIHSAKINSLEVPKS